MSVTAPAQPSMLFAWWLAIRPRTLVVGAVPVVVGTALAMRTGVWSLPRALAALAGALLIQIGTNLANDYYDHVRGADGTDRLGPPRASAQGWLQPSAVKAGAFVCFALAVISGAYLVAVGGWPVLVIGLTSVIAGYAYTGGPFPLGYHGLGDVFVWVFFGFVAVGGTYFVQAGLPGWAELLSGAAVGALGVGILAVNNLRDRVTDVNVGKRTLAVRFGPRFARAEYVACVVLAFGVPVVLAGVWRSPWPLVTWAALPLGVGACRVVLRSDGAALNAALAATARLMIVWGVLFSVGVGVVR